MQFIQIVAWKKFLVQLSLFNKHVRPNSPELNLVDYCMFSLVNT